MTVKPPNALIAEYERALTPDRQRCLERPSLRTLLGAGIEPRLMHRFLIELCARGVQMTAPVPDWIERAGARCCELGATRLGEALRLHARHEAGHDELFAADAKRLVARYNAEYQAELDVGRLLEQPPTPATARYVDLHESTIAGPAPYGQIAIELEIERLSPEVGIPLLRQVERVLGPSLLQCLSFIVEHTTLDVGHTALNRRLLSDLLSERPAALEVLIDTGRRALATYLDFLDECFVHARTGLAQSAPHDRERARPQELVLAAANAGHAARSDTP